MSIIFHGGLGYWEEGEQPPTRVMSTFSGIGAASISWMPDEIVVTPEGNFGKFDFVAYAEIAPFPCHVLHYRRGASRPRYMLSPLDKNLTKEERSQRSAAINNVSGLPETGVVNFGDISQITDDDLRQLGQVDVLEGGSPCQSFSFAGLREGLNDPRGNLMLVFCRLAERMRKINGLRYVVWENVHGVLSDETNGFGCLLASLAGEKGAPLQPPGEGWSNAGGVYGPEGRRVAWRTLEAANWGVPQRRKRVFVVANIRDAFDGVGTAFEVLFESHSSSWNLAQGLKTRQAVVSTYGGGESADRRSAAERYADPDVRQRLEAEASPGWVGIGLTTTRTQNSAEKLRPHRSDPENALGDDDCEGGAAAYALADDYGPKASKNKAFTLLAGSRSGGGHKQMVVYPRALGAKEVESVASKHSEPAKSERRQVLVSPALSGTLYARDAAPIGKSSHHNFLVITREEGDDDPENWIVRKFTPLECERLQGFPDYWTDVPYKGDVAADGHRYKAIGNSMACPVMAFIGDSLNTAIYMDDTFRYFPEFWKRHVKQPRGRPPKNGIRAMSDAERQRQRRARLRKAASARS